jgi:hypothetical protein
MAPLLLCQRYEGYGLGLTGNIRFVQDLYPFSAKPGAARPKS